MDKFIYPVYFLQKIVKKRQKVFFILNSFATQSFFDMAYGKRQEIKRISYLVSNAGG